MINLKEIDDQLIKQKEYFNVYAGNNMGFNNLIRSEGSL